MLCFQNILVEFQVTPGIVYQIMLFWTRVTIYWVLRQMYICSANVADLADTGKTVWFACYFQPIVF